MTSSADTSTSAPAPVRSACAWPANAASGAERACRVLPVTDAHLQRRGLLGAAPRHEAAPRLQRELVAGDVGQRSLRAERLDRDDAGRRPIGG